MQRYYGFVRGILCPNQPLLCPNPLPCSCWVQVSWASQPGGGNTQRKRDSYRVITDGGSSNGAAVFV